MQDQLTQLNTKMERLIEQIVSANYNSGHAPEE